MSGGDELERSRPDSAMTRRRLIATAALGAAAVLVAARGRQGGPGTGELPRVAPGPGDLYRRGVNSYTLNYAGDHGQPAGEPQRSYAYLSERGHRLVRLPFTWGYVQPELGRPLDAGFLAVLENEVAEIADAGMRTILDVHSSGRHPTAKQARLRFGAGITPEQFEDLWLRLSERFADHPGIYAYDLMNEPFEMPDEVWQEYSQRVVEALRSHGDRTLLWIEGSEWSLASEWRDHQPMPWIDDPLDKHAYSAHTYPGAAAMRPQQEPEGEDHRRFLADLRGFIDWLGEFGVRGSIGEVGWPSEHDVGKDGAARWNHIAAEWYAIADAAHLDVTYFGASSAYDNWLWAYDADRNALPAPGLRRVHSQAAVIEAHPTV